MDKLFSYAVARREQIITVFKIFFLLQITFLFIGARSIYYQDENLASFYQLGVLSGKLALIFYIVTTIPGITRRFNIKHKAIAAVMFFRRYIGIAMFLFVVIHYWFIRGIDFFLKGKVQLSPPLFEIAGTLAFFLTMFLFITSNDFSVARLGKRWGKIHKLTYAIIFLIFLHVFLQRISIWSILIAITAFAQILSHLYGRLSK